MTDLRHLSREEQKLLADVGFGDIGVLLYVFDEFGLVHGDGP